MRIDWCLRLHAGRRVRGLPEGKSRASRRRMTGARHTRFHCSHSHIADPPHAGKSATQPVDRAHGLASLTRRLSGVAAFPSAGEGEQGLGICVRGRQIGGGGPHTSARRHSGRRAELSSESCRHPASGSPRGVFGLPPEQGPRQRFLKLGRRRFDLRPVLGQGRWLIGNAIGP